MYAHTEAPNPPIPDFLSIVEFAELLGIGKTTAYDLAKRNELPIPVLRVGRQYRVSRKAYEALKDAQHVLHDLDAAA